MKRAEYDDVDCMVCLFRQEIEKEQGAERAVGGKSTRLETGGEICFVVPGFFTKITLEEAGEKYLYECCPEIVYREAKGKCDFLFQKVKKQSRKISEAIKVAKETLYGNDKEIIFYGSGKVDAEEGEAEWFEYKSFAESEEIYNMIFMAETEMQRIFGAFNCMFEEYDRWKPIVIHMLGNLQIMEEKVESSAGSTSSQTEKGAWM